MATVTAMATIRKMVKNMTVNKKLRAILNIVGVLAVIATVGLIVFAVHLSSGDKQANKAVAENIGIISFDANEIIFDGTAPLDLMAGVHANDGKGNDITSSVNAIITSDGTQSRKIVRYTCFDANGHSLTATRTLVMKNYSGPSLSVSQPLQLDAADLVNLITHMQTNNLISAYDGFGRNITSQVTCLREPVSTGLYKMTFRIANEYQDEKTVAVYANISGKVDDPAFELYSSSVSTPLGQKFEPMNFVVSQAACVGKFDIDSNVDVQTPGNYRVIYTAYSTDRSAKTTQTMQVTVTGDSYD